MPFILLANAVMVSRLGITLRDRPMSVRNLVAMSAIQLASLVFLKMTAALVALAAVLVLANVGFFFLERRSDNLNGLRLVSLAVTLAIVGVGLSAWTGAQVSAGLGGLAAVAPDYFVPLGALARVAWREALVTLAGFWLATSEANLLIRFILGRFDLTPKVNVENSSNNVDSRQYNYGRVVGLLERALIYYLVVIKEYQAIGIILAAKSLRRLGAQEDRAFLEYVLVGTLLSFVLAMLAAALALVFLA